MISNLWNASTATRKPDADGVYLSGTGGQLSCILASTSALAENQTIHMGASLRGAGKGVLKPFVAYRDAAGNMNWVGFPQWTPSAEWQRFDGSCVVPSGMTISGFGFNKSGATGDIEVYNPVFSYGSPVVLAMSEITATNVKDGDDGCIISETSPADKTRLWYDTNSSLLKKYDDSSKEWMVVNDASDDINSSAQAITAAYTSSIEKVKNSITSSVDVAVSRIDSNEKTIETLSSQIQQNAGAITATTNTVKSVNDSLSGYTTKVEIREWARFSNGVLELGKSSSNFNTKLSNTELGFYEIGKRIAFISNQELNITKARILDKMYIGDYLVDDDDDYGFIIM